MRFKIILAMLLLTSIYATSQTEAKGKMLQHVVIFKFKDGAKPEEVKKITDAFKALQSQIKEIRAFEWGTKNSPENLNQGFTHCFVVSFASEKDRDAYLPHPKHKEFVALLGPVLEKALVVDYWQEK